MACKTCSSGSSGGSTNVNNICVSCGGGGSGSGSGTGGTDPGTVGGGIWQPPTGSSPGGGNGKDPPTPNNPPDPSSGSGPGGSQANGDVRRNLGGCMEVFAYGFCAPTINLNVSLRTAIEGILTSNGGLQPGEKLISCRLNAYGRATITAVKIGVTDTIGIDLGDLTQDKIFINDADGTEHEVKSTHETTIIDIPLIGQIKFDGLFYNGTGIDIPLSSGGEVTLHGRLQRFDLPLFNDSSASTPNCDHDDSNQSAGFRVCVTDYVVRPVNADNQGYGFKYTPLNNVSANFTGSNSVAANILWDDNGINRRSYADGNLFRAGDALFGGHDTFEPSSIYMSIPADRAYTNLTITGKTISTAQTINIDVHDRTVGTAVTYNDCGTATVPPTSTPADGSDAAHTPHEVTVNCTFSPPLIVGHNYQIEITNAGGGTPSWFDLVGTFGGV